MEIGGGNGNYYDDDQQEHKRIVCGGGTICCILIFIIILLSVCFESIEPIEIGLKCNSLSKKCDDSEIFQNGLYFVSPFTYFIKFPRIQKTIKFSKGYNAQAEVLKTRTKEGLSLGLHVSFQYKLQTKNIGKLYSFSNGQYEQTFVRIARDNILQAAGEFEAPDFWKKRGEIGKQMQKQVQDELSKNFADVVQLQILDIELPETYENQIVLTQVEQQRKRQKEFEQEAQIAREQINIQNSKYEKDISIILADSNGEAYSLKQNATAYANSLKINSELNALENAQNQLELTEKELNDYLLYSELMLKPNAQFLVGINQPILNIQTGGKKTAANSQQ